MIPPDDTTNPDPPRKRRFGLDKLERGDLTWPVRLAFLYAGILLPIICHLMTVQGPPDAPSWQSGALKDELSFTLSGPAGFVFYPLMVYPMFGLTLLVFREKRFAESAIVRFGIFTGIPVAAWYCAMLGLVVADVDGLLSWRWFRVVLIAAMAIGAPLLAWGVIRLALWLRRKLRIPWYAVILGGLVLYGLSLPLLALENEDALLTVAMWPLYIVPAFFIFSLFFAPHWALGVYLGMTLRLLWRYPRPLRFLTIQLMAALSWMAAFLAACRWSIVQSLVIYSRLPTEDPGTCYVASAAAYGHRGWVGSETVSGAGGGRARVNRQLRVLKAAELALCATAPALHRSARRVYNYLGPLAARRLRNPYFADVAYLALKPAEWTSFAVLRYVCRVRRSMIDGLFAGPRDDRSAGLRGDSVFKQTK